jgi:hypothetical protein
MGWCSGSACIVVDGSISWENYHFSSCGMYELGYSVGPKYEFVLIDKGIVERVAVTFSGHRQ